MSYIIVSSDGTCFCGSAKCVLGRVGSMPRCTHKELEDAGYKIVKSKDNKSDGQFHDWRCIDGEEKVLELKCVTL